MHDWAFASTNLATLVSYIDPANARAIVFVECDDIYIYRYTP